MNAIHKLKTDTEVFQALVDGRRTFEIRFNDRNFKVGDELVLLETIYTLEEQMKHGKPLLFSCNVLRKTVSYVLSGYGLQAGWVILGITSEGWMCQQSKIDELQRRNQMLNENIKEQGQKLVYQNEVIETQAEKLLGLRDEKAELQKQVDALKGLAQTLWEKSEEKHQQGKVWESKTLGECADEILDELEQALKGENK